MTMTISPRVRNGVVSALTGTLAVVGLAAVLPQAAHAGTSGLTAACTQTVTGDLAGAQTVASGQKLCLRGANVGGAITVQAGGSLSSKNSTVNGAITASGAKLFEFCGSTTVGGALSVSGGVGKVKIGDNNKCGANTVGGAITVANNTRNVSLARTTTGAAVTVSDNVPLSGIAPLISANNIGGALTCAGNAPAPTNDNKSNTVAGGRSGQCVSPTF